MEEHDKTNPLASVDALVNPHPLTMARIALLSRVNSPVLFGHADDVGRNLEALYLANAPITDAAKSAKAGTSQEDALVWSDADKDGTDVYVEKMCELLDAITAFWKMLPNSDPEKKTASATVMDGLQNSSSGGAAPTDGQSAT